MSTQLQAITSKTVEREIKRLFGYDVELVKAKGISTFGMLVTLTGLAIGRRLQ